MMMNSLNHWHADDAMIWAKGNAGLGHLMLRNTPESLNEYLPLHDEIAGVTITADARLDNRDELCMLLHIESAEAQLLPDSDMILRLYRKYRKACVKYLIGDFAFAIWDEGAQELFCARDHMGVKPFFYYAGNRFFAFASEKKGLLCIPGIDKTIDRQFFCNLVFDPSIQAADTTIYKSIRRVPPAHTLCFSAADNRAKLEQYWTLDPHLEIKLQRKEDYYEGLQHHFEAAVKCRLRSTYLVGAELSGGLDSSAITGVASHLLRSEGAGVVTFSNVGSADPDAKINIAGEDERKYIDEVVRFNAIDNPVYITRDIWNDPVDEVDFALKVNDGLELWSMLWLLPVKKAAMQKNVRTLLSGFPGDEMVTYLGYRYFLDYLDRKQYLKYFGAESHPPFNKMKPFIPAGLEFSLHKLKNMLMVNSRELRGTTDFFKLTPAERMARGDVAWQDKEYRERYKSYRHFQKYRLLKPQVALRMEAETRFGLYFRSETRFPMADIRLTQYYLSMPNELKYEGEIRRNAFRLAAAKYLPETVLKRDSKRGNIAPFRKTDDSMHKRKELLMGLVKATNSMNIYDKYANEKALAGKYLRPSFLELLRWWEKNFESL